MYEVLLVGGVLLWLTVAVMYARSGLASVFHPATYYMVFHGFIFVVRPIIAFLGDYRAIYRLYQFSPSMAVKSTALLVADLGFICFMAAVLYIGRVPLVLAPTRRQKPDTQRSFQMPLLVTAAILAPLGVYSLRYVLSAADDETAGMVFDAATGVTISSTGNGYFFSASDIVGALSVLVAWQFRFRPLALVPFALYFVARASVGGSRWTFVLTSAALALFWLYDQRRRWPSIPVMVGAAALLVGFAVVGQQRNIVKAYLTGGEIRQDLFKDRLLEGMDFANLEYLEYHTWAVPERTGTWGYFTDNLQVLSEPIPRVLWPSKPIGAPIKMWDLYQYGNPIGITSSLPGVGWDQLGYFGVAIWCLMWGGLFGRFYRWFACSRQTAFNVGLYVLLLPMMIQIFRDGSLLSALKFPMWYVFTVAVWFGITKLAKPRGIRQLGGMRRSIVMQPQLGAGDASESRVLYRPTGTADGR